MKIKADITLLADDVELTSTPHGVMVKLIRADAESMVLAMDYLNTLAAQRMKSMGIPAEDIAGMIERNMQTQIERVNNDI